MKRLCNVRDHGEKGEYAYNCNLCYEMALRQQQIQVRAEQKEAHHEWLASLNMKKAA